MYSAQMEEYAKALEIYEQVGISFEKLNLYSTNNVSWLLNCQVFITGLLHSFIPNNDRNWILPHGHTINMVTSFYNSYFILTWSKTQSVIFFFKEPL